MNRVRCVLLLVASLVLLAAVRPVSAQFGDEASPDAPLGKQQTERWQVDVTVRAVGGPCRGVFVTMPVPTDWPEQTVKRVDEEMPTEVSGVRYTTLSCGVRQMHVRIPSLETDREAKILVTFEVTRSAILAPTESDDFVRAKRMTTELRKYLGVSPLIETTDPKIRALARQLGDDKLSAWAQVEVLYDWVRANVEYKNGPIKGALAALNDRTGDCEELTSLFIALCRIHKIPARTVWVPGHCYPEFYLVDGDGNGRWFPCQAAGDRDFGSMPETRPVLQKGDSFRLQGQRTPLRYAQSVGRATFTGTGEPQTKIEWKLLSHE